MKPEVKNWLEQAEHDIEVAEYNFDGNMLDAAAFYSQQAAEKALKSLYISKFNKLWKVHDLVRIAKRIEAPTKIVRLCAKITPAYTGTRYPDVCKEYDRRDFEECKGGAGMGEDKSKLVKALKEFKDTICQKYDIREVILFGSQVSGTVDENSDVDLIVVGNEFKDKSPLKRPFELYLECTMDYPVDFLCYTPEEFEEKRKEISIVRHAINEGIAI